MERKIAGAIGVIAFIVLVVTLVGVAWRDVEQINAANIAAATAPWSGGSVVRMELRSLTNSDQIEIKIESGYQQEQTKLKTIEITEEEGIVEAVARSKHFTLPKGETVIYLPVSSRWIRIRVILSLSSTYADRLTVEAELTREGR